MVIEAEIEARRCVNRMGVKEAEEEKKINPFLKKPKVWNPNE